MDGSTIAEMIRNAEGMIRTLQEHVRQLRNLAGDLGLDVPRPAAARTTALREEMDRMRQDIIAKADAERRRIMREAGNAAASARSKAAGAGGFAAPGFMERPLPPLRREEDDE